MTRVTPPKRNLFGQKLENSVASACGSFGKTQTFITFIWSGCVFARETLLRWLKQFNDISGWIPAQDLFSAGPVDDVVEETGVLSA
jgi:hypothetical protein